MAENSNIEWCDHTFNPWRGCTKVSAGCAHCYAETLSKRNPKLLGEWGKGGPRVLASDEMWRQPLKWNKRLTYECPSCSTLFPNVTTGNQGVCDCTTGGSVCHPLRPKVFCASLADWLDDEVPIEWLARLLALIYVTPNLDWLLLTKRPENWRSRIEKCLILEQGGDPQDVHYFEKHDGQFPTTLHACWLNDWTGDEPPNNVWLGTSVEDQVAADARIPALLKIPAKVRFLSCEPLLGPVDLTDLVVKDGKPGEWHVNSLDNEGLHPSDDEAFKLATIYWVIAGGESGPGARPMEAEWARSLRDQCNAAGVPFLFKQWGGTNKKATGRLLDGRTWDKFPKL